MPASALQNAFYTLRRLSPILGAEIIGVNLQEIDLSTDFISQLVDDLKQFRMLLFRGQHNISGERQVDISSKLGKLESTFYKHPRSPHPDIFRVSNDETEGCTGVGRTGWHIDGTFQKLPFKYQTMHFPEAVDGGDTHFIPLRELYEAQDESTRDRWNRLWMMTGRRTAPVQPLVYLHPYRGH